MAEPSSDHSAWRLCLFSDRTQQRFGATTIATSEFGGCAREGWKAGQAENGAPAARETPLRSLCRTPSAPRTPCRIAIRTINQTSPACPEELAGSTLASQNLDPASVGTAAWLGEPLTSFNRRFDAGPKPDTLQAITRAPRSPMRSPLHRILSWSSPCHDRCTIVRRFAK